MTPNNQPESAEAERKAGFAGPPVSAWWKVIFNHTDGRKGMIQLVQGTKADAVNAFACNRDARYLVAIEQIPNNRTTYIDNK